MSGLPPRQPPAQQALAPPQWATSLTLAERESVIAKITERLRALVASGVPTENVRRAAVHLEAAAFQHATSMEVGRRVRLSGRVLRLTMNSALF